MALLVHFKHFCITGFTFNMRYLPSPKERVLHWGPFVQNVFFLHNCWSDLDKIFTVGGTPVACYNYVKCHGVVAMLGSPSEKEKKKTWHIESNTHGE